MSPEQAAGQIDQLGPASDIYSLGATLYNLLTGKVAFDGTDVFTLLGKIRRGRFPATSLRRPDDRPRAESVCLKAMALTLRRGSSKLQGHASSVRVDFYLPFPDLSQFR